MTAAVLAGMIAAEIRKALAAGPDGAVEGRVERGAVRRRPAEGGPKEALEAFLATHGENWAR